VAALSKYAHRGTRNWEARAEVPAAFSFDRGNLTHVIPAIEAVAVAVYYYGMPDPRDGGD
jgi:hypothetical protein